MVYDPAWARLLPLLKAMTQIQKILLEPAGWHHKYLHRDIDLDSQLHDKIIILKPSPYCGMDAQNLWSEVCGGHLDYWQPDENEIDLVVATDAS